MQDLFGNEVNVKDLLPFSKGGTRLSVRAHKALLLLHGTTEGKKCGSCKHLYWRSQSRTWCKCRLSGLDSHSPNTDWSSRWPACGKFEPESDPPPT